MKVQVERVLYDSPDTGFHICKAAVLEATQEDMIPKPLLGSLETLTIKGYFPVNKIVNLLVKGSWEKSKYGYALVVNEFKEIIPPTKDGIIAYLSATVYGIKESMAKKIVGQFGLQTLEVFENSPEQLLTVKGIGRQRLQKIIDSYKDSRSIQEIVSYLAPLGVTANKCAKIAKAFGGEAMNVLLNEPFRLCEIDGFGFLIVDQIARKTTFSLTDPMRICGAIRYVLQAAATEGHLCYRQLECICYAYLLLNDVDYKCAHIVKAVNEFINTNNALCLRQYVPDAKVPMTLVIEHFKTMALGYELKGDNGLVYLPFEYEQEVDIADIIAKRLTQNRQQTISDEEIAKAIREKEQDLKIQLAEKQKEAVALGVKENTCIITGGPGVGKTTVLKVVLSVCLQFGKLKSSDVTLLAPTGRAAQRMAESVGGDYTASTIHSALKIGGDDMRTFEPLDSKIVVVDEASMVDSHICWLLLNAVPDDAKLILIGDPEQLPSVGAGNVLFEFLNCQRIPTVRLDVIYRQAGTNSIVTNAGLIQQGVTKLTYDDDFRFFDVHATEDFPASDKERGKKIQSEARDIVIEQFMSAVKSEGLDEVQVLCPFRKKGVIAGATELNKEIQQRLNPPSYRKPEIKRGDRIFRLGDKVIQTKNNRDIGIFNGDVGYIKRIDTAEDEIIMTGYMIPVYNYFGYIEGIQIRLDRPFGKTKYLWFSSNGLPGGAATAAIPFYMKGSRKPDTLIVTEGAFKAIIPNKVFGYSLLALPGVNNIREFEKLLPYIRQDYRQILIAFDADFRINENVAKAKEKLRRLIYESDIYCSTFEWDLSDGKGLDDFALHWIKSRDNAEIEGSDE